MPKLLMLTQLNNKMKKQYKFIIPANLFWRLTSDAHYNPEFVTISQVNWKIRTAMMRNKPIAFTHPPVYTVYINEFRTLKSG